MARSKPSPKITAATARSSLSDHSLDGLPHDLVGAVLSELAPIAMPKKREAKLKTALMKNVAQVSSSRDADTSADISTVRAGRGAWMAWLPGIDAQILYDDGKKMSWLARFEPGARMAAHDHEGDEESIVIQGACYVGRQLLAQGDYQLARHGSRHAEIFSPDGCVLLMRTPSLSAAEIAARTATLRV
jgi:anti-sigma factor ChrR (cupin superfamily)